MTEFTPAEGDLFRINIPDETDPDHHLHGEHGQVVKTNEDDAGVKTSDDRDSAIYRIRTDEGGTIDAR